MYHIFQRAISTLQELGFKFDKTSEILDFGCGSGVMLKPCLEKGWKISGCDFSFGEDPVIQDLLEKQIIRPITTTPYHLPFDDGVFDLIISWQVFEHVQDYQSTLFEIKRVMKPNGICINIFPSRYKILEPHLFVPFAAILPYRWWFTIWAYLGIRNQYQKGLNASEVIRLNCEFMATKVNYLTKKDIARYVNDTFEHWAFCENVYLKYSGLGQRFPFLKFMPFISWLSGNFIHRVLVFGKGAFKANI